MSRTAVIRTIAGRRRLLATLSAGLAGGVVVWPGRAPRAATAAPAAPGAPVSTPTLTPWHDGRRPPWVTLRDRQGRAVDLNAAPYAGRVRVVNVWATWCGPCLNEMPSLAQLHRHFAGKAVDVVAVDLGDSINQIDTFLERTGVDVPILMDPDRRLLQDWHIQALPLTYVFDRDGRPVYRQQGPLAWDHPQVIEAIAALLS